MGRKSAELQEGDRALSRQGLTAADTDDRSLRQRRVPYPPRIRGTQPPGNPEDIPLRILDVFTEEHHPLVRRHARTQGLPLRIPIMVRVSPLFRGSGATGVIVSAQDRALTASWTA